MADDTNLDAWLARFQGFQVGDDAADGARTQAVADLIQADLPGLPFDSEHAAYVRLLEALAPEEGGHE